jgi:hypothetical protein
MRRTLKMLVVPTLALVVGLVAGFALGQRQGLGMGLGFLESEVTYSLSMHVEAASRVRVGDTERALELLDSMIDATVLSQHQQPAPHRALRSMSDAKVYRRVIPSSGPNAAAVRAALEHIAEPDRTASGLATLVRQSGRK